MTASIVLGGSGYIGSNLLAQLSTDGVETVQVSRRRVPGVGNICVDLASADVEEFGDLFSLRPTTAYILGRPTSTDFEEANRYHYNVKRLVSHWARSGHLRSVVFTSTSLVYPDSTDEVGATSLGTVPRATNLYEYSKLDFEAYLQFLATAVHPDIAFAAYRIPIVFGGTYQAEGNTPQHLYWMIQQYLNGRTWKFDTAAELSFGTSWLHLPDFVRELSRPSRKPGFELRNCASGYFKFADLHEILSRLFPAALIEHMPVNKCDMRIKDECGMQMLDIEQVIRDQDLGHAQ
ncbi:nucleoside-diphosphate-sugar epimerase [Roseateles asaccharophilus]|uniref:NAD-dependent epimerase/dehydratase family protein n=1 Tax=Roseateles asaccharophilus TaxID=582607 RepID=UPI0038349F98